VQTLLALLPLLLLEGCAQLACQPECCCRLTQLLLPLLARPLALSAQASAAAAAAAGVQLLVRTALAQMLLLLWVC
jgi:hypothetical protein